jgi:hypothetical protein
MIGIITVMVLILIAACWWWMKKDSTTKSGYEQELMDRIMNRRYSRKTGAETAGVVQQARAEMDAAEAKKANEMIGGRPANMSSYMKRGTPYFFAKSGMTPTVQTDLNAPAENTYKELADESFMEDSDTILNSKRFKAEPQLSREPILGTESMFRYTADYHDAKMDPLLDNPWVRKTELVNSGISIHPIRMYN